MTELSKRFPWIYENEKWERREIHVNAKDEELLNFRGHGRVNVTDQLTGKRYRIRGASCGLPRCMCDKEIVCELTER